MIQTLLHRSMTLRTLLIWMSIAMMIGYYYLPLSYRQVIQQSAIGIRGSSSSGRSTHVVRDNRIDNNGIDDIDGSDDGANNGSDNDGSSVPSSSSSPSPKLTLAKLSSKSRWSVIPQGWHDYEPYGSDDRARCISIDDGHHHKEKLPPSLIDPYKPWWFSQLVLKSVCGRYHSMKKCHQQSAKNDYTCQWALQGYCFNYTSPNIGWFQAETYPGGLSHQHKSALNGFDIAHYVQLQLYPLGVIATLLPRFHRQSPIVEVKLAGSNNDIEDFRPFRHFYDPASVYCPYDMGPIIERPRLALIAAMGKPYHVKPARRHIVTRTSMGTYQEPFCHKSARNATRTRADELVTLYRRLFVTNVQEPHLLLVTRTFDCQTNLLRHGRTALGEYHPLSFARRWHRIADVIIDAMLSSSLSTPRSSTSATSPSTQYIGLHLRREEDICSQKGRYEKQRKFCLWSGEQWLKCISHLQHQYQYQQQRPHIFYGDKRDNNNDNGIDGRNGMTHVTVAHIGIGYVATDGVILSSKWFEQFSNISSLPLSSGGYNVRWHSKLSLSQQLTPVGVQLQRLLTNLKREELALIDQLVVTRSQLFIGVKLSSYSELIAADRQRINNTNTMASVRSWMVDKPFPTGCFGVDLS